MELSTLREMVTNMEEKAFLEKQKLRATCGTAAGGGGTDVNGKVVGSHQQQRHARQLHSVNDLMRMNEFNSQLKYLQNVLNGGLHFNT